MRFIVCAILLASAACRPQVSGSSLPETAVASLQQLQPPPKVLADSAIRFSLQLGVYDDMIASSPELSEFNIGLTLPDEQLAELRALARRQLPAGQSVYGAVAGPTASQLEHADARMHAPYNACRHAFSLDETVGQHIRIYVPSKDSKDLTQDLKTWVRSAYMQQSEPSPKRRCEANGAAVCVESPTRFVAVTDEGWGARIDIAEILWPPPGGDCYESDTKDDDAQRQEQRLSQTSLATAQCWARAYGAPGLRSAPASPPVAVSVAADPHAVTRLAQALVFDGPNAPEIRQMSPQELSDSTGERDFEEREPPYFPPLTDGFPFSDYVAHWTFEDDKRSIELEWHLNDVGNELLAQASDELPTPSPDDVCQATSACVVVSESFSGFFGAARFNPTRMRFTEAGHLVWPLMLGVWPNVVSEFGHELSLDPKHAPCALAGAAWRDRRGRVEFALGYWSSDTQGGPEAPDTLPTAVEGKTPDDTRETNVVIVDSVGPQRQGKIAASDHLRATWLDERPIKSPRLSEATIRFADLRVADQIMSRKRGYKWSGLEVDLQREGHVVRGHVVFERRHKADPDSVKELSENQNKRRDRAQTGADNATDGELSTD